MVSDPIAGTGRHGFFKGYSGHGENSAQKSTLMGKPDGGSGAELTTLPETRKGHGELVAKCEIDLGDPYWAVGLPAVHCTSSGLWVGHKKIA